MKRGIGLLFLVVLFISLGGCNTTQDEAGNSRKGALPIGYYSNEDHEKDNDGPLIEMLDHNFGAEGKNQAARHQDAETNPNNEIHEQIEKINASAREAEGVADTTTIITGNKVLVAVQLKDGSQAERVKAAVKEEIKDRVGTNSVTVVTDKGAFERVKEIETKLRKGTPAKELEKEMEPLFQS